MFEHGKPPKRKLADAYAKYVNLLFLLTKKGRRCCLYMNIRHVYPKRKRKKGNSDYFQKSPEENDKDLIHYVND